LDYPFWWLIGTLFYLTEKDFSKIKRLFSISTALIILVLINREHIYPTFFQSITICSLFACALVYRLPENRVLINISSFSYTLYVLHFPLLLLAYSTFSFSINFTGPSLIARAGFSLLATYFILSIVQKLAVYAENVNFFQRRMSRIIRKALP